MKHLVAAMSNLKSSHSAGCSEDGALANLLTHLLNKVSTEDCCVDIEDGVVRIYNTYNEKLEYDE